MNECAFAETLDEFKNRPIAVYGLGAATEKLLPDILRRFRVVGLLDGFQSEGFFCGAPVISLEEAFQKNVAAIVVIARESSVRIIVNRIGTACKMHGVRLFDVEGKDLLLPPHGSGDFKKLLIPKEDLRQNIDAHDVISFDIFDTLLTREVLYPSDIFSIVEEKAPSGLKEKISFVSARQKMEREIARQHIPTFEEIYKRLRESYGLTEEEEEYLKRAELETEETFLVPRRAVCDMLHYAQEKGKTVILVSDMYLSDEVLSLWLRKRGITGYQKLYVSSAYQTDKRQGLFRRVRQDFETASILHIGDNREGDIEAAEQYAFDAVKIASGRELFEAIDSEYDCGQEKDLAARIQQGFFIARVFNSPFSPMELSPEDIGYAFFAPMLSEFILWLYARTIANREKTILFGARDGFLPCKMFRELQRAYEEKTEARYFLTSRESASLAGIMNEADVRRIWDLPFTGSLEEKMKARFKIFPEEIKGESCEENTPMILSRAKSKRRAYLAYIHELHLQDGKKAFFDFVSVGTCQYYLEKIMEEKLQGYYFIKLDNDEEKNALQSESWLSGEVAKRFLGGYVLMETILSAPRPSLREFDEEGTPVYGDEHRDEEGIQYLERIHGGILEYFGRFLQIAAVFMRAGNSSSSLSLFQMLQNVLPPESSFWEMRWNDGFYGRNIKLGELV